LSEQEKHLDHNKYTLEALKRFSSLVAKKNSDCVSTSKYQSIGTYSTQEEDFLMSYSCIRLY